MRTLRSRSHRVVPAAIGLGAVLVGFLLLSYVTESNTKSEAAPSRAALAAQRSDERTANRGAGRGHEVPDAAQQIAAAAQTGALVAPADEVDPTTTVAPAPTTTTTVAPTTTAAPPTTSTTVKPRPRPTTTVPAPVPAAATAVGDDVWDRLARCESGGNPKSIGGGGRYFGAFQFTLGTWHSLGYSGNPIDYPYATQVEAAKKLQARSGWGQWPVCSRQALNG